VWSAVSGRLCKWYDAHLGPITSLSWHHPHPLSSSDKNNNNSSSSSISRIISSSNTLVTGCEDGVVRLWSIQGAPSGAGKPLYECWAHRGDDDNDEDDDEDDDDDDDDEDEDVRGVDGEVWGVGCHSRGVSDWLHGPYWLSSIEPCFDCNITW
jgi:hypothetical protein